MMIIGMKTSLKKSILLFGLTVVAGIGVASFSFGAGEKQASAAEPGPKRWSDVLRKDSLGFLEAGKRDLKMRIFNWEYGGETPYHTHDIPGARYILEGEITIFEEDGTSKTYKAGDTYFAGPMVGNNPIAKHKAKITGKGKFRVLIVELIPEGYKKKK
jgi:quercetin dioxygenase-like cupin family protein